MLLSKQIMDLAQELREESAVRPYVRTLIPDVVDDKHFWTMIVEMLEIVVHRNDYVIVDRSRVMDVPRPRAVRGEIETETV